MGIQSQSYRPFELGGRKVNLHKGLCVGIENPDRFHVDDEEMAIKKQVTKEAKQICHTPCPVLSECLTYAITNRIGWGVYGGMTYKERRQFAREGAA